MTHSSLFSPNNHVRHSHYLQPESLTSAPPSSFGRKGGFLKKIPSVLFNKEKTPIKEKSSKGKLHIFADSPPKYIEKYSTQDTQPTITVGHNQDKKTKKPRKALADLFGWGNHHHTIAQAPSPVSQPMKSAPAKPMESVHPPSVPPKDYPTMLKKLNRPPSTKSNNSQFSSLRPPMQPPLAARSSIGDDPFVRNGRGAEVVDHFLRHTAETPSAKSIALDRRASVSSSKALSCKTSSSDIYSTKGIVDGNPSISQSPSSIEKRPVPAPLSQTSLTNLPPRSASLGKLLGSSVAAPLSQLPESPIESEEPIKILKKEKTKSRVWGLLGGNKSKKDKVKTDTQLPALLEKDPWAAPADHPATWSLSTQIDNKYAAATVKSNVSSMQSIKRPPLLHISAPSMDCPSQLSPPTSSTAYVSHSATRSTFEDHEDAPQSTPSKHPLNSGGGGVWESVIGTSMTSASHEDPCHAIEALMGPSRLPKRKSLTGLFGLPIRRSIERIKPSSAPRAPSASFHRVSASPPRVTVEPTLRSLAEEIEEASNPFSMAVVPSSSFTSRFGLHSKSVERRAEILPRDPTDKLLNLVSCLDFSPGSSASPTLHHKGSYNSIHQGLNGSPTPVRRLRSAMLSTQSSGSSLRPPAGNVSPLKVALCRAQAAINHKADVPVSPPRDSMVRKGMRNIFAPASPAPPIHGKPTRQVSKPPAAKDLDEGVGMGHTMGPNFVQDRAQSIEGSVASDIPADLKALINITGDDVPSSFTLGLPVPPPQNRTAPRRPGPAPPALSLPPVPDMPLSGRDLPANLAQSFLSNEISDSVPDDMLSCGNSDNRNSFDFTSEYASLELGTRRASFVEALSKVSSVQIVFPSSSPPVSVPREMVFHGETDMVPSLHVSKPSDSTSVHGDSDDEDDEEDDHDDETFDVEIGHVVGFAKTSPVRREPFRGQFAFQQHVAAMPHQDDHPSLGVPEPALAVPDFPPPARRGHHNRGESGLSIATMSSIGSVIGAGKEREYTNYFDVNFTNHQTSIESQQGSDEHDPCRVTSHSSVSSTNASPVEYSNVRSTTRRGHHQRNSSIVSIDSLSEILGHTHSVGPPVSLRNGRRTSYGYISRHRRNGSSDSTFGRPDWAAHRRNSSSASTNSNRSVSQIVRPGLGDRMFQLDGGVQLTSITGSPPDGPLGTRQTSHRRQTSWDSLFDGTRSRIEDSLFDDAQQSRDSMFDSDTSFNRSSTEAESLFGPDQSSPRKDFFLKGLRPVSTISTNTSESHRDDTFQHVQKYMQNVITTPVKAMVKEIEAFLQGDGEDMSKMTPLGKGKEEHIIGRQMLGCPMSRPQKPGRRRPAQLIITEPPLDTPGLTSPSASETSSRISLDTDAASISLGRRIRPSGAGHYRQKSSAGVKVDATIHEMPSAATLRGSKTPSSPQANRIASREPTIVGIDNLGEGVDFDRMRSVRNWVEWEREAVDEFRKTKHCWRDSEESKHAVEDWKMPTTTKEIAAFLAQSSQAYKPLDQLPIGKIAHRRKSSLSESRFLRSPYGLPLPKPENPIKKPKMSLTTKYEKKNSTSSTISSSSAFAFAFPLHDDVPEAPSAPPLSAAFAQFSGSTPPPLATFRPTTVISEVSDIFGVRKHLEVLDVTEQTEGDKKRNRVTSSARREALGWGRRRNSDGPEKTIGLGYRSRERDNIPPMPNTAIPSEVHSKTSQQNKGKFNKNKSKEKKLNIFSDKNDIARPALMPFKGQENLNSQPSKSKTKSPMKKRGLRQAVSQPRTLRV
ncbi:uncharacterized protein IL334_005557 [Kwoniella shivajii]|uniref:Uncharacterized protein n=1 Tax=Kwoniella shivajii TaxID=564305 RepID=A0ABZ1D504_9TREE|nr:hypothetical protein IL334_005557 [Kwoniella shivajii]